MNADKYIYGDPNSPEFETDSGIECENCGNEIESEDEVVKYDGVILCPKCAAKERLSILQDFLQVFLKFTDEIVDNDDYELDDTLSEIRQDIDRAIEGCK